MIRDESRILYQSMSSTASIGAINYVLLFGMPQVPLSRVNGQVVLAQIPLGRVSVLGKLAWIACRTRAGP
jgi:hypothetical protein